MPLSRINRSLVLAALVLGVTGGRAYAQEVIDVKVPFDFQVRGKTFPAGTYELTTDAAGNSVVSLRGEHGNHQTPIAFLTIPASGHDPAGDQPSLVFSHRENQYLLSQIWESNTEGRQILRVPERHANKG